MRVLVACEYSATVRSAFDRAGCDAWSCDLIMCEKLGKHYRMDIMSLLDKSLMLPGKGWDLIIAHPPCQFLAVSGNRWYAGTEKRQKAFEWTMNLWEKMKASADHVAMENPVGVISSLWRPPDQYIQPWQFGHGETKKTGLWLHNLPKLQPTNIVSGRQERVWRMGPSPERAKERARFYTGIADAMAEQWGSYEILSRKNTEHKQIQINL